MEIEKLHRKATFGEKLKKIGLSTENLNIYQEIPDEYLNTIESIYFNNDLTLEERQTFQEKIEASIIEKHLIEVNPNFIVALSVCSRLANKKAELHRNEKAIAQNEKEIKNVQAKQKRLK